MPHDHGEPRQADAFAITVALWILPRVHAAVARHRRNLLFGTGIIFGSLISDTGLAETIGTSINDALGLSSIVAITVFAVLLAIIVSETASNTA